MGFRIKHVKLPDPETGPWPDIPTDVYRTYKEARIAVHAYIRRHTVGGYNAEDGVFWIRDSSNDMIAVTHVEIVEE